MPDLSPVGLVCNCGRVVAGVYFYTKMAGAVFGSLGRTAAAANCRYWWFAVDGALHGLPKKTVAVTIYRFLGRAAAAVRCGLHKNGGFTTTTAVQDVGWKRIFCNRAMVIAGGIFTHK